jgi:nicotinate dehydrogenase subunit A
MSNTIAFSVNGQPTQAPATMAQVSTLSYVRETLGLRRARFGCGSGSCGACTVHVNGQAVTSCDLPVEALAGCNLHTPEVLGTPEQPDAILASLLEQQAAQCGYCVSGIAMRIKALMAQPHPISEAQLLEALNHHLCRCGAQVRMLRVARGLLKMPEVQP